MKLTLQDVTQNEKLNLKMAGITLPSYDIEAVHKRHLRSLYGLHFGAGNISAAILQDCRKIC